MIKKYVSRSGLLFCAVGIIFLLAAHHSLAQGPGLPGDPGYDPDKEVPIDGGTSLLLALGLAYGIKKIKSGNASDRN
jgi:hypothetical protein